MPPQTVLALAGLSLVVAVALGVLVFAILRLAAAGRAAPRSLGEHSREHAFVAAALEQAVSKLRDQERATSARAEAFERLNSEIVSSLTSGLLVVGLRGEVRILNPAGRRLLGVHDAEPPAQLSEFSPVVGPLTALIEQALAGGEALGRRVVRLPGLRSQREVHFGVTVSPLRDAAQQVHGAVCLFNDITAIIELEEQLRLKESLARLGELLAGLAHELRNGLATIHGYVKLLAREQLPRPCEPYLDALRRETDAMSQTVTSFLNFAKPTPLELAPVDLERVARRAAEDLRGDVERAGGDLIVRGEFATVDGDERLLRQALGNLIRNGIEACTAAGVRPLLIIEGSVDGASGAHRISVLDNGPGVPPKDRERVFYPFVTSKRDGTGLGLALVQKIVVTHNGRVSVTDRPEGGACFSLTWSQPKRPIV